MTATTTKETRTASIPNPLEPLEEFGEQLLTAARKAGTLYLDTYEKAVDRSIEAETKLADLSGQEWVKAIVESHISFTREFTEACTTPARQLLR